MILYMLMVVMFLDIVREFIDLKISDDYGNIWVDYMFARMQKKVGEEK